MRDAGTQLDLHPDDTEPASTSWTRDREEAPWNVLLAATGWEPARIEDGLTEAVYRGRSAPPAPAARVAARDGLMYG
jgi:hypothetical protein